MRVVRYYYLTADGLHGEIDLLVTGEGPTGFQVWDSTVKPGVWTVDDEPTSLVHEVQSSELLGVLRGAVIS